jgi:TolB protein
MKLGIGVGIAVVVTASLVAQQGPPAAPAAPPETARETHLSNVKQLTFGGENAEAYFSFDGQDLIFQSMREGGRCDQIYAMRIDGTNVRRVSSGEGRTTCSFFTLDKKHVVYASTFLGGKECPPRPDFSRGYVWPIYHTYDIFKANADGTGITRLTSTPGYDAEATIGPDGRIVFTSVRDGDMEIYSMNADGGDVKRLTHRVGPDGGPFFSRDGKQIVFRGRTLEPGPELDDYRTLLRDGLWRPTSLEIFVMNPDGGNLRQVTSLGGASFAPYFSPDGKKIIFASNKSDPRGRDFELWLINVDGTGLEQVTWNPSFDGFPMFSPDGKKLVFASNRFQKSSGETNVFIADWSW